MVSTGKAATISTLVTRAVQVNTGICISFMLGAPDVVVHADAWTVFDARQRRERQPAGGSELADPQRQHDQHRAGHEQPEAERVDERERDVARTDLQRHGQVHQAGDQRHRHEEDHDHAVGGEDLVVVVRRQVAGGVAHGHGLLGAHHDGVGKAAQQHDQRQDDVHGADALVVDGGDPLGPDVPPLAVVRHGGHQGQAEKNDDPQRAHDDGLVIGDRL
ncbi:hypothetical protein G6F40_014012 [Rhizopus arrhizus]|nr:hypothetical protein G6F40_014012 [Rhizopus arrhizus]